MEKLSTEETKKQLLQAKHRMEAAQARDRKKERSARTRRLILEGAELEGVVPEVREMTTEELRPSSAPFTETFLSILCPPALFICSLQTNINPSAGGHIYI